MSEQVDAIMELVEFHTRIPFETSLESIRTALEALEARAVKAEAEVITQTKRAVEAEAEIKRNGELGHAREAQAYQDGVRDGAKQGGAYCSSLPIPVEAFDQAVMMHYLFGLDEDLSPTFIHATHDGKVCIEWFNDTTNRKLTVYAGSDCITCLKVEGDAVEDNIVTAGDVGELRRWLCGTEQKERVEG